MSPFIRTVRRPFQPSPHGDLIRLCTLCQSHLQGIYCTDQMQSSIRVSKLQLDYATLRTSTKILCTREHVIDTFIDLIHHLQRTATVLHRRHAYLGFQSAAKNGQLVISAILSYLLDRLGGIAEHAASCIDSRVHNIGMRRITGCLFEYPNEAVLP